MAANSTCAALGACCQHFRDEEMSALQQQLAQMRLDWERRSMEAEDLRSASFSPLLEHTRYLTWRELAARCNRVRFWFKNQVVLAAVEILQEARKDMRTYASRQISTQQALSNAHNAIVDAEECLEQHSYDDAFLDELIPEENE